MFVERFAGGSVPTHSLVSSALLQPPRSPPPAAPPPAAPVHRALLAPARLLEACLHSLLSFLTSNFPSNPLLPDSLFSIERPSLRPVSSSCTISCCAQVLQTAHLHRRAAGIAHHAEEQATEDPTTPSTRTPGCQHKDPRTPSTRTPGHPARGPHDTQREDPSLHYVHCATLLDLAKVITQNPAWDPGHMDMDTCPWDPPTVNPPTATGTPCTFPVGHAGPKTLDPGLPLSRETHLLTDELR
ncbi:uncharacterized protein LOC118595803 isoform X2 [Onychomys torridus]|uniref:uncharacterized protein LOC118595803 isoform X2 n=1 Tax=Onychomys torridus TaxID=38674 RepID=UPI00167F7E46|nr:uncharacterized protein LOC118595803 isoform X2 [Onychomys torridus]